MAVEPGSVTIACITTPYFEKSYIGWNHPPVYGNPYLSLRVTTDHVRDLALVDTTLSRQFVELHDQASSSYPITRRYRFACSYSPMLTENLVKQKSLSPG